ncbi:MAG: DNA polymerase III subunit delta [Candidatus Margulisbacteria bacterium]|jgi:DNA polymerase-3 subunit delta|nr:DNA polymerase III subunit delta [Candidatus Margulisiibacteriota bacterium]
MAKLPVYLYNGDETYLIDEAVKEQRRRCSGYEALDGRQLSLETLSNALCGQGLFCADQLVVIDQARIAGEDQPVVIALLENLAPGTTVIWREPAFDGRTKLFKWIASHGTVQTFKSFAPWEQGALLQWVKTEAERRGKPISAGGARLLIEVGGRDLRWLVSELEKLITFCAERPEIGEADVAALASPGEIDSFALLEKLRRKDLPGALALFQRLVQGGVELNPLLGLIATQYRLLLQIKALPGRLTDPGAIARELKASPYFVGKSLEGVKLFSLPELKQDMALLLDTSLRLKGGEQPVVMLETLIATLCRH